MIGYGWGNVGYIVNFPPGEYLLYSKVSGGKIYYIVNIPGEGLLCVRFTIRHRKRNDMVHLIKKNSNSLTCKIYHPTFNKLFIYYFVTDFDIFIRFDLPFNYCIHVSVNVVQHKFYGLFELNCAFYDQFQQNIDLFDVLINFAITEVLGDLLKIFLFYFERNIKINNVFRKNKKRSKV